MYHPTKQQFTYSVTYDEESRTFLVSEGELQAQGGNWVRVGKGRKGKRAEKGDFVMGKVVYGDGDPTTPTVIQTFFSRNKLPPFIQTVISLMTPGSTATATTTLQFINRANLTQLPSQLHSQSKITVTVTLYEVAKMPVKINSIKLALDVIEEIVVEGKEGDCFMQQARYEKALKSYENAVKKVLSQQFAQAMNLIEDQKHTSDLKQNQHNTLSSTQIQTLFYKCKIICYKYLELCLVQGEQLKVVKVGHRLLKQFGEGWRVYNVLVYAYCRLGEEQLAKNNYLKLMQQKDANQQLIKRLNDFLQQSQINLVNSSVTQPNPKQQQTKTDQPTLPSKNLN